MESAVVESHDAVHADRDEAPTLALDDDRAERTTRAVLDIFARDPDRQAHAILDGLESLIPVDERFRPGRILDDHARKIHRAKTRVPLPSHQLLSAMRPAHG